MRLARVSPAFWLLLSGVGMSLLFHVAFAGRYPLARFGDRPMQSTATINRMAVEGAVIYAGAFSGLFALYWAGYHLGVRRVRGLGEKSKRLTPTRRRLWLIVVGFAILMNLTLLPMYPLDAADIYDYIVRGRMSAVYGLNPLQATPRAVSSDPFYPFAAWRNVPSAYGPLWEMIAALTSRIAGDGNTANVVAFKIVSVIGYLAAGVFICLTLWELAPRRVMIGVYLFLWNPLVIYIAGGTGHNDTLMAACIALSVFCLARRWFVAATLAAVLGGLIKFIPLFLVPIIAVVALRDLGGRDDTLKWRLRLRYLSLSAGLGLLLAVAVYGPFWFGIETLRAERRSSMYTSSWATIIRQTLAPTLDGKSAPTWTIDAPNTNALLSNGTLALFGTFYLWGLWRVYRERDSLAPARVAALILMFYLLVACLWFQSWYVVWALALAAVLDDAPLRRLTLLFSYLVTWQPLIYNYVTLRPGNYAPLPWRDLVPVSVFMGGACLYIGWHWLSTWLRRVNRTPLTVAVGCALQEAREAARLTPADLADEIGIPTHVLLAYERGEIGIPLDRLEALQTRLGRSDLIPRLPLRAEA